MRKNLFTIALAAAILWLPTAARAGSITLAPVPPDLYDLDHNRYYSWGPTIDPEVAQQTITSAVLRFEDIRNWDNDPNVLYVHLLDSAAPGVTSYWDGEGGGDNLAGEGIELVTYTNLSSTPQDLEYELDLAELTKLNEFLDAGGDLGLGFDPDCHFYNNGLSLSLCYDETPPVPLGDHVPEPTTVFAVMVAIGGLGMYIHRRRGNPLPSRVIRSRYAARP